MKNEVNNKMLFGMTITFIGLVFSVISFFYAIANPAMDNGINGLLGSLLFHNLLIPFILGTVVMVIGLILCFKEAYKK